MNLPAPFLAKLLLYCRQSHTRLSFSDQSILPDELVDESCDLYCLVLAIDWNFIEQKYSETFDHSKGGWDACSRSFAFGCLFGLTDASLVKESAGTLPFGTSWGAAPSLGTMLATPFFFLVFAATSLKRSWIRSTSTAIFGPASDETSSRKPAVPIRMAQIQNQITRMTCLTERLNRFEKIGKSKEG